MGRRRELYSGEVVEVEEVALLPRLGRAYSQPRSRRGAPSLHCVDRDCLCRARYTTSCTR